MTPTPTPTSTAVELSNASASVVGGFASSEGLAGPLLAIGYIVGAVGAAQFVSPWLAESQLLNKFGSGFVSSIQYAIKGVAASAVLMVLGYPVYFLATAEPSTQRIGMQAIGGLIGIYVALAGVGWLADRAVRKFLNAHPEYDEWGDIFPEPDDPDEPDAVTDGGEPHE